MKKKLLTVLLAVATAAALYGCGPDEGGNTQTQAGTQAEETVKETAKETEAAETEAPYERGTVSDVGFESEWLNIRFTATENDVMATQEEIDSLMDSGSEVIEENTGVDTSSAQQTSVTEMMVSRTLGVPSIQLLVEDISGYDLSEEQYLDTVKAQLEAVGMGYTFPESYGTRSIAGQDHTVLKAEATYNGVDMVQEYAVRRQGDRMIAFVMTCTPDTQEDADALFGQFMAIR